MKKKVYFIRHYKLEPPFDRKETISTQQRILLGRGEISPGIHSDINEYLKKNESIHFNNLDIILSSPTKRTVETANTIKNHYKLSIPIKIENSLKEAIWNPALGPGRIRRFINESGLSRISVIWNRFEILEKELDNMQCKNILCMTHSFLIQNLYLFFHENIKDYRLLKEEDIRNSLIADYLEGFTVEL